jgi:hypothetical protein
MEEHPMGHLFRAGIVLLLVVSVTRADGDPGKKAEEPKFASGTMRSLEVKDGVGTVTILVLMSKQGNEAKFAEMKFAVTRDTRFYWFGSLGADGRPSKQGAPVSVDDVAAGLRKYGRTWIFYTGDGDNLTATMMDGHP